MSMVPAFRRLAIVGVRAAGATASAPANNPAARRAPRPAPAASALSAAVLRMMSRGEATEYLGRCGSGEALTLAVIRVLLPVGSQVLGSAFDLLPRESLLGRGHRGRASGLGAKLGPSLGRELELKSPRLEHFGVSS
jgi:hypothetical protein